MIGLESDDEGREVGLDVEGAPFGNADGGGNGDDVWGGDKGDEVRGRVGRGGATDDSLTGDLAPRGDGLRDVLPSPEDARGNVLRTVPGGCKEG